jgi:Tol biopolymer transport system component
MKSITRVRSRHKALMIVIAVLGLGASLVESAGAASASFPGENGRIAFTIANHGGFDVYSMQPDGSSRLRLTTNPQEDSTPAWSPDGTRIAYDAATGGTASRDIFIMNANGTHRVNLTHDDVGDSYAAWSPSGRQLVFQKDFDLYRIDVDGSNLVALTSGRATDGRADWSPDGTSIAFDSDLAHNYEIFTISPDGSDLVNLTNRPRHFDADPSWSPDGSKIAFWSSTRSSDGGNTDIFTMNADGTGVERLTGGNSLDESPAWSPDGTKIAFWSYRDGDPDIFVLNADGSGRARRITHNHHYEVDPAWQPLPEP